jgi:phage terminase large subunit-like protein
VCAATTDRERGWVVEDLSGRYDPEEWAQIAVDAMTRWAADYIVAEKNQGGAMVAATIRAYDRSARVRTVWASKGKRLRAEPVAVMYQQGRVLHVGTFVDLEEQMTTWVPEDEDSPDRLDALVYALTDLMMPPERRGGSVSAA